MGGLEHKVNETEQQDELNSVQPSLDDIKTKVNLHIDAFCRFLNKHIDWNQERFDKVQRKLIEDILTNIELGYNIVLEAPTGVGKSIIAMFVGTYKQSYVCTSDKMLQDQYDNFIKHMMRATDKHGVLDEQFTNAVCLKGQDNYPCALTGLPFTTCTYQEQGYSFKQIAQKFQCYKKCKYLLTRDKAIESQVAVFNYNYWLMQMHIARQAFKPRLTIFDECHKIDDILQNFMDITVGPKFVSDCTKAESFIAGVYTHEQQATYVDHKEQVFNDLKNIIELVSTGQSIDVVRNSIQELVVHADYLYKDLTDMLDKLAAKSTMMSLSPFEVAFKNFASKTAQLCFGISTMLESTEDSHGDLLVVLHQDTNNIAFKCVNDALLCTKLINTVAPQQVWMSATIGDIDEFARLNAIQNYKAYNLSSAFDFTKSPIYLCKPLISLSWANKAANLPKILKSISDIMQRHPTSNGVIHTSTREIARYIVGNMSMIDPDSAKRLITYDITAEKKDLVAMLRSNTNHVIVAYSMTEGVSLDDDKCRFQIIAKLSWQSLADLVVKTKADNHPEWYTMKVAQAVIQSIGRGIRHEKDWCTTYVLDSSITRVLGKLKKSKSFAERLQDLQLETPQANVQANFADDDFFKEFL